MSTVFTLGFRPFFLLAGLFAIFLVGIWVPTFLSGFAFETHYGQILWHGHEMIFGYTSAVIAGFLLTAVRNWTGQPTPSGAMLAGMAGLWLLGRILPYFPAAVPHGWMALVDMAFLPAVAVAIGAPLVRSGEKRNLLFLPLLGAFWAANGLVHAELLGGPLHWARSGMFLGVNLVVLLIVIMGGRVIPFFTERALAGAVMKRWAAVEWLAPASALLFLLAEIFAPDSLWSAEFAALAACANGVRMAGWYNSGYWRVPLLWVLHVGYAWVVAGFVLKAIAALDLVPHQFTIHTFTVGGIGVLTLGMMARVSLGHTGRPLAVGPAMAAAFVLINLAAVGRGLGPAFFPQWFSPLIVASGVLWVTAFLIFVILYTPILIRPRSDGRPG